MPGFKNKIILILYNICFHQIPETVIGCSVYEGFSDLIHDPFEVKTEHFIPHEPVNNVER